MCTTREQRRGPKKKKQEEGFEELRKLKRNLFSYFTPEPKPGTYFSDTIIPDEVVGPKKTPEQLTSQLYTSPDPKLKTQLPSCEVQDKVIETTSLEIIKNLNQIVLKMKMFGTLQIHVSGHKKF